MCNAWGTTRLVDLGQHLLTAIGDPPAELVRRLEDVAIAEMEELLSVSSSRRK